MESDSDESLELHDLDPQAMAEAMDIFDYNDALSVSPQLRAVLQDDVSSLRSLLQGGKSVNINDNQGNTPLHVAVLKEKRRVFDYLLQVGDIRLDAENFEAYTPLMLAAKLQNEYYLLELLKKEVDVDVISHTKKTALHLAVEADNPIMVGALIESGSNINHRNCEGDTPLHKACRYNSEVIHWLLYHGADVTIESLRGEIAFDLSMLNCPLEVQQILYDYTFDELRGNDVSLKTLTIAMMLDSPLVFKLMEGNDVVYHDDDLNFLKDNLEKIPPRILQIFTNKFDHVIERFLQVYNRLSSFYSATYSFPVDFFYTLSEYPLFPQIVVASEGLFRGFRFLNFSEDVVTSFVCYLLSYSYTMLFVELYGIFYWYGYRELFSILLHMRPGGNTKLYLLFPDYLLPALIQDYRGSIDKWYNMCGLTEKALIGLRALFRHPVLVEHKKTGFGRQRFGVYRMPSLLELARNSARRHLVRRFRIRTTVEFFTMLRALPISQIYRDILSYKKAIYEPGKIMA